MSERAAPSVAFAFLGVLLVVAAIALGLMAFSADRHERELRDGALRVPGTVVGVVKRQKGDAPLVRFETAVGEKIDFTATDAGAGRYRVGEQVMVFYHPDNPRFSGLDTGRSRWQRVAILGVFAVVCAAAGVRLTWSNRLTASPLRQE